MTEYPPDPIARAIDDSIPMPTESGRRVGVAIVDGSIVYAHGLAALIERQWDDFVSTYIGADFNALLDRLRSAPELVPDVALVDLQLPGFELSKLVAALEGAARKTPSLLLISPSVPFTQAREIMQSGVRGFLTKDRTVEQIIGAIKATICGGLVFTEDFVGAAIGKAGSHAFSERDRELMLALARGESNRLIARRWDVSERTVRRHLERLYWTLGVSSRHEAMVYAVEHLH